MIWNFKSTAPPKKLLKHMKEELKQMQKTWKGPEGEQVRKGSEWARGFSEGYMKIIEELLG